jgi:hypothetical protein
MKERKALAIVGSLLIFCAALTACTGNVGNTTGNAKTGAPNEYPIEVLNAFMDSCKKSGGKQETCLCVFEKVQQKYTFEEYSVLEAKMAGGQAPEDFLEFVGKARAECMK